MIVKENHSLFLTLAVLLLGTVNIFASHSVAHQSVQDSIKPLTFYNQAYHQTTQPWLLTSGGAWLSQHLGDNRAYAELSSNGRWGEWGNMGGANSILQAGANVSAYQHLSQKTVVYGQLNTQTKTWYHEAGSLWLDAERKPFDLIEDSLGNEGRKHLDSYRLTAALSTVLFKSVAWGFMVDYTAANYAKYKDLRHQNTYLDLNVSTGFIFSPTTHHHIGVNLGYHRNIETIRLSRYASSAKTYKTLINYANFMGYVEQFDNDGFTGKNERHPLVDEQKHIGLEWMAQWGRWKLFQKAGITLQNGYYGKPSPYTIRYTQHEGKTASYDLFVIRQQAAHTAVIHGYAASQYLQNKRQVYREAINESGAGYYEYFEGVKTADKLWWNMGLSLIWMTDIQDELPRWMWQMGWQWHHRKQTGYDYPFYRSQSIGTQQFSAGVQRGWQRQKDGFIVAFNWQANFGSGKPFEDKQFTEPSDKQKPISDMNAYLYRDYLYRVALVNQFNLILRYNFIMPGTHLSSFIKTQTGLAWVNSSYYTEEKEKAQITTNNPWWFGISMGCAF